MIGKALFFFPIKLPRDEISNVESLSMGNNMVLMYFSSGRKVSLPVFFFEGTHLTLILK